MVLSQIEGVNSDYFIVLCMRIKHRAKKPRHPVEAFSYLVSYRQLLSTTTLCILLFLEDILSFYEAKNNAKN